MAKYYVKVNKQVMPTCKKFIEYLDNYTYGCLWLNVKNCGSLSSTLILYKYFLKFPILLALPARENLNYHQS